MTLGILYHKIAAFAIHHPGIAVVERAAFLSAARAYLQAPAGEGRKSRVVETYKSFISTAVSELEGKV